MSLLSSARVNILEPRARNRLILFACILGSSIVFVDSTVVNVALPTIKEGLGGGLSLQQWVVDAYLLTVLVFAIGLAMTVAPLTATVLADAGPGDAGIASGVNNAVARVAGLLEIAVVGVAVAGRSNELDVSGFRVARGITAALVACGGFIGLVGIRNP